MAWIGIIQKDEHANIRFDIKTPISSHSVDIFSLYKFNSIFQTAFLTYWSFEEWTELNVFLHFYLSLLLYLYVGVWVPAGGVGHGHFGEFT